MNLSYKCPICRAESWHELHDKKYEVCPVCKKRYSMAEAFAFNYVIITKKLGNYQQAYRSGAGKLIQANNANEYLIDLLARLKARLVRRRQAHHATLAIIKKLLASAQYKQDLRHGMQSRVTKSGVKRIGNILDIIEIADVAAGSPMTDIEKDEVLTKIADLASKTL